MNNWRKEACELFKELNAAIDGAQQIKLIFNQLQRTYEAGFTDGVNMEVGRMPEYPAPGFRHIFKRPDGYYFYDPAHVEDGPFPTPEIAEAALTYYMDYIF